MAGKSEGRKTIGSYGEDGRLTDGGGGERDCEAAPDLRRARQQGQGGTSLSIKTGKLSLLISDLAAAGANQCGNAQADGRRNAPRWRGAARRAPSGGPSPSAGALCAGVMSGAGMGRSADAPFVALIQSIIQRWVRAGRYLTLGQGSQRTGPRKVVTSSNRVRCVIVVNGDWERSGAKEVYKIDIYLRLMT
ncbi:hypothetical protein B0H10DRAFT_1961008 [Mycena sp. CBHHK59/15]|nr:hypothetical protein B0H10DRAFT_1961008 [Mycena sp. CBHHK59/15]